MAKFPSLKLLSFGARLHVIEMRAQDEDLTCLLSTTNLAARCPTCQHASRRVHNHCTRHLADVPLGVCRLHLELHARKFFCDTPDCSQRIFAERLDVLAQPYARCTQRLLDELTCLADELGGEAGARTARRLHLGR